MPDFKYRASDETGKITEGAISAHDRKAAAAMLEKMSLSVISVKAVSDADQISDSDAPLKKGGGEKAALALFKKLQQLCGSGGMPVSDALKVLGLRSLDPKIKGLSRELYKDLSEGKTLAAALAKFPDTFDVSMTHLVEAGESTANLGFVFDNIINYIDEKRKLRRAITSALAYPIFLCVLASGVVMLFLFFMLPRIKTMMSNMGAEENVPIKMMNLIGDAMTVGLPILAVLAFAAVAILKFYRRTDAGLVSTDAALLKIPQIGKIVFDAEISKFANLAATLFGSGVNTTETFRLAEKSFKNSDLRARFRLFRTAVNDGAPISAALQRFGLLDNEDVDVIAVGERTGNLVSGFGEIASTHSESLQRRIKTATAALGGAALGGAFLLVFVFAMGIVLSILGLSQSLVAK